MEEGKCEIEKNKIENLINVDLEPSSSDKKIDSDSDNDTNSESDNDTNNE